MAPAPIPRNPIKTITNKHMIGRWKHQFNTAEYIYYSEFLSNGEYKFYDDNRMISQGSYRVIKNNQILIKELENYPTIWKLEIENYSPIEIVITVKALALDESTLEPVSAIFEAILTKTHH